MVQELSESDQPMNYIMPDISRDGILRNLEVRELFSSTRLCTAGYVVCRHEPATAKGRVFHHRGLGRATQHHIEAPHL